MRRGDVYWARLPRPLGRRPVVVVTRTSALAFLARITVAPVTTTIRGVSSEVQLGRSAGLPSKSVAGCDSVMTVARDLLDEEPIGTLTRRQLLALDDALIFALGISR